MGNSIANTMRFFEPAESQPCYYCKRINVVEHDYPLREGSYTFENYVYRCAWHARFICSKCGEQHHFSWLYWCPKTEQLICGDCEKPILRPLQFWDRTYAYAFYCKDCSQYHFDLFYSEFQGVHPWQLGNRDVTSNLETPDTGSSMWIPDKRRDGKAIELVEALTLPNRVMLLREDLGYTLFQVLQHAVPEDTIDSSDAYETWEQNSEEWITRMQVDMAGDSNRRFIIDPALWSLLGDVRGLSVLDAGCGNGYLTRELATKGANAVGVDYSNTFIEYCQQIEVKKNQGCTFYKASITAMTDIESNAFDIVVSNIVMVDILDYFAAFKEIARVLKDDGRFIWSNVHPVFGRTAGAIDIRLPRDSPRNESRYLKMIDRYFDSGGELITWLSRPTWQFNRTLEEYSKALKVAGFVISEILEPRPTLEVIQQNPRDLAFDADRWPHFIIIECLKRK